MIPRWKGFKTFPNIQFRFINVQLDRQILIYVKASKPYESLFEFNFTDKKIKKK